MRVPTKKLYRAFPELDPFTDRQCELFVQRVKNTTGGMAKVRTATVLATVFAIPVTLFILAAVTPVAFQALRRLFGWRAADVVMITSWIAALVGLPALFGLLVRDSTMRLMLRNAIKVRIERIQCLQCRYPLLGQTVTDNRVRCPECGTVVTLRELGLDSPDDLIPPASTEEELGLGPV